MVLTLVLVVLIGVLFLFGGGGDAVAIAGAVVLVVAIAATAVDTAAASGDEHIPDVEVEKNEKNNIPYYWTRCIVHIRIPKDCLFYKTVDPMGCDSTLRPLQYKKGFIMMRSVQSSAVTGETDSSISKMDVCTSWLNVLVWHC